MIAYIPSILLYQIGLMSALFAAGVRRVGVVFELDCHIGGGFRFFCNTREHGHGKDEVVSEHPVSVLHVTCRECRKALDIESENIIPYHFDKVTSVNPGTEPNRAITVLAGHIEYLMEEE